MRILSQRGRIDLPYEKVGICINAHNDKEIITYPIVGNSTEDEYWSLAEYSTEAKARKAMEMLREQYAKLCSLGTYLQGGMELFAKSMSQGEAEAFSIEYKNMNVFQFPADNEVEV